MTRLRIPMIYCLLTIGLLVVSPQCAGADEALHSAIAPASRPNEFWQKRQAKINERTQQGDIDLIFLGDSITQGWKNPQVQQEVWGPFYGRAIAP